MGPVAPQSASDGPDPSVAVLCAASRSPLPAPWTTVIATLGYGKVIYPGTTGNTNCTLDYTPCLKNEVHKQWLSSLHLCSCECIRGSAVQRQARAIGSAVRSSGRAPRLLVGCSRRFGPSVAGAERKIVRLIENETPGAQRPWWRYWRAREDKHCPIHELCRL